MLTWLGCACRRTLPLVDVKWHNGDPRKSFAFPIQQILHHLQKRGASFQDILEKAWCTMLAPFAREYVHAGAALTLADGTELPRPLGLVLTRAEANLFSGVGSSRIADETWRSSLGPHRVVYVDVPHGVILLDAGVGTNDILQLRAIFAAPFCQPDAPQQTLFIAQMTDRARSEAMAGLAVFFTWTAGSSASAARRRAGVPASVRSGRRSFSP